MSVLSKEIAEDWYVSAFAEHGGHGLDRPDRGRSRAGDADAAPAGRRAGARPRLRLGPPLAGAATAGLRGRSAPTSRRSCWRSPGATPRRRASTVEFVEADLRELDFDAEFDLVLSLNDGAIGYFETDEENRRTFEVISRSLKPGGRHLMQLPNVLYAREHLPQKSWISGASMIELVEHRWNKSDRYMEGAMIPVRFGEVLDELKPIEFRQRLYTVEELGEIMTRSGWSVDRVFHGNGKVREPTHKQFEIFVESHRL